MTSARALVETLRSSATPDAELVRRYVDSGDADAFAALVLRHGGPVWRVCRAVAGNPHDADDAYQVTFLLFARNAGHIRQPARVAAWLHGVAVKVAGKARSRRRPEPLLFDPVARPEGDGENAAALHAELARLPDKYRVPLVLCALEGRSRAAVAADLGWTLNRLKSCLEQGRERLRKRLAARGIVGAGLVAVAPLMAAPPVSLDGLQTDGIASLLTEVSAMTSSRIGRSVAVLAGLAVGVFGLAVGIGGQPPAVPKAEAKAKADPKPPAKPMPTWERTDLEPDLYEVRHMGDLGTPWFRARFSVLEDLRHNPKLYNSLELDGRGDVSKVVLEKLLAANPWPLDEAARFLAKGEAVIVTANGVGPPDKPIRTGHYLVTWRHNPVKADGDRWNLAKVEFATADQVKPLLAKFEKAKEKHAPHFLRPSPAEDAESGGSIHNWQSRLYSGEAALRDNCHLAYRGFAKAALYKSPAEALKLYPGTPVTEKQLAALLKNNGGKLPFAELVGDTRADLITPPGKYYAPDGEKAGIHVAVAFTRKDFAGTWQLASVEWLTPEQAAARCAEYLNGKHAVKPTR